MNDDDYDCRILDEASMVRSPAERPSRNSPQATWHSTDQHESVESINS